jgi:hypothetical protein
VLSGFLSGDPFERLSGKMLCVWCVVGGEPWPMNLKGRTYGALGCTDHT